LKIGGYNFVNDDSDYNKIGFLHNKYIGKPTQQEKTNMSSGLGNDLSIDEIIDIAGKSKNGLRFKALYEGGWDQFYDSQSEADMAFVSDLAFRSEEHTSELQSRFDLVCRLLLEKKK